MKSLPLPRLANSITRHPGKYLLGVILIAGVSGVISSRLEFQSSYLALLPEDAPEVKAIEQVRRHTGGTNELVIAVGGDKTKRLPFARRVVRRLNNKAHLAQWAQVEAPVEFFHERGLWLLPIDEVRSIERTLRTEVEKAKAKANPLMVDLEDEDDQQDRFAELRAIEKRQSEGRAKLTRTKTTSDGNYLLVFVKPNGASTEIDEARRIFEGIRAEVALAQHGDDPLPVRYAGGLISNISENQTMSRDLASASMIALVLAIGLITLSTRRATAVLVIGLPLVLGLVVTLAAATLLIGHLNLVSGFLVAALVGLGIDFGVHLYLRFLDVRSQIYDPREAMRRAITATFGPCLTAATTTSVAFLSLIVADFRGFSEYGLVAAVGVMLTLFVTFVALPPVVLLLGRFGDRLRPFRVSERERRRLRKTRQLARPLAWLMAASGLAFIALSVAKLHDVGFENNFRRLKGVSEVTAFDDYITKEVGGSLAPALVMVNSYQQVDKAAGIVKERLSSQGVNSAVKRYVSVADLVPSQVKERTNLLASIRKQVDSLRSADLGKGEKRKLEDLQRMTSVAPWTEHDLPESFRRRLVAASGEKYYLLLWSRRPLIDDDAIQGWAAELDALMASFKREGIHGALLDENLVAARVLTLIRSDGPKVMVVAGIAVIVVLLLDFRRLDRVLLVGGSVALGLVGMLGVMALFDLQLNLFNAVVLPTVLGIGIDNAVHLQHAYTSRGKGSIPLVVATSGRAALLSSATTAVGFGSAVVAHHVGIQEMAILALVGIGCTFVASTIFFPAVLRLLEGTGERKRAATTPVRPSSATGSGALFDTTASASSNLQLD